MLGVIKNKTHKPVKWTCESVQAYFNDTYCTAAFASTVPLMLRVMGISEPLELTVMDFEKEPTRLVSYLTIMLEDCPGAIGSLGHCGIVQPHELRTFSRSKGSLPSFLNTNSYVPLPSCSMVPKSWLRSLNLITGPCASMSIVGSAWPVCEQLMLNVAIAIRLKARNFFISS